MNGHAGEQTGRLVSVRGDLIREIRFGQDDFRRDITVAGQHQISLEPAQTEFLVAARHDEQPVNIGRQHLPMDVLPCGLAGDGVPSLQNARHASAVGEFEPVPHRHAIEAARGSTIDPIKTLWPTDFNIAAMHGEDACHMRLGCDLGGLGIRPAEGFQTGGGQLPCSSCSQGHGLSI